MSFNPANIKSKRQIEDLFKEQLALLNASISNNLMVEDALEGKKQGITPTVPLPLSREERNRDIFYQQQKGLENLKKILDDPIEAGKALSLMDEGDIILLNRSAPFIISDFSTKYKEADADFFLKYFKQLIQTQTSNKGLLSAMIPVSSVKEKEDEEGNPDEQWDLAELKSYVFPPYARRPPRVNASKRTLEDEIYKLQGLEYELLQKTQYLNDPKYRNSPEEKEGRRILVKLRERMDERVSKLTGENIETASFYQPLVAPEDEEYDDEEEEGDAYEAPALVDEEGDDEGAGLRFGMGFKINKNKRLTNRKIVIGRGLVLAEPQPRYVNFGKFVLHYNQLKDDNNLNIKYKSLGGVPQIRPTKISNKFRDFLLDLIDNKKMSQMGYNMLDDKEKKYFKKIVKFSNLDRMLGLNNEKEEESESEDEDDEKMKRWELVKGQYLAGNNADSVKHELIKMVYEFTVGGQISKEEGEDILLSLFK